MRKVYYIYNPQTQTYDRIYPTVRQRALSILRRLFIGMGLGAGSFIILLLIFGSHSEKELRKENSQLLAQYNVLSRRLDEAMGVLQDIQQRDDNLYRVIFMADPVSPAIRQAGYGGTNRYEQLMDMANSKLVINTTQKMDVLSKQLYIQSKSFDDVVAMCKNHDQMLKCIPAIQPISNKDLRKTASGYGTRIDPIYGTTKFHAGMDFSAHPGTDVYATGDGTVVKMGWETGYGNTVEIDHGFGYRTRYAHLQEFRTKLGKKVVRGDPHIRIGDRSECFGQTGTGSTRKNMPANVTVTNMNNAHSIFRTPVLHQPQMFEHRSQYPKTIHDLIPPYTFESYGKNNFYRNSIPQ